MQDKSTYAMISYLVSSETYLVYNQKSGLFEVMPTDAVKSLISAGEIWNMQLKNNKPVPIGISISRFELKNNRNTYVAIKEIIDSKTGKTISYEIVGSNWTKQVYKAQDLIDYARHQTLEIANLKVVCPDKKAAYISKMGADIPTETRNLELDAQLIKTLAYNIINGIVEISDRNESLACIKQMLKTSDKKVQAELVKKALEEVKRRQLHVYSWQENGEDGRVIYKRISCSKEKIMCEMSMQMSKYKDMEIEELRRRFCMKTVF